ncbi:NO-associated protein 1 chloroplastic/mitochondrial [Zea mays]|uniref:NO-associated protein 1 chloroplastic/mitochondrial n=1 Tax=Zea mays TaxID=4577 RepID=A0A1D6H2N1_MAIZE|nr:NO-associated protein 1 chloroplastic/mitochondrial [Zea mays]
MLLVFPTLIVGDPSVVGTMAYKDPVATTAQKYKPIQSVIPETTLGPIQIEAFLGGGANDTDVELNNALFVYEQCSVNIRL